jgi:hypothetical protein
MTRDEITIMRGLNKVASRRMLDSARNWRQQDPQQKADLLIYLQGKYDL